MTTLSTNKRLEQIKDHISGSSNGREHLIHHRQPNDVVIVSAVRTPICKAGKKGAFRDMYPEDLLDVVLRASVERIQLNPACVNDIQTGNCLQEFSGIKTGRMAMFNAGFPYTTTFATLNRQCASGLEACHTIANAIKAGEIDIGIGSGVESMSNDYGTRSMPTRVSPLIKAGPGALECIMPMGITSENVAQDFSISRQEQDQFSVASNEKAVRAQSEGLFESEIVPVKARYRKEPVGSVSIHAKEGEVKIKDPKIEPSLEEFDFKVVNRDDGPRAGTTVEKLGKLAPVFKKGGSTTAGNASQVSDGAAAVVLMRRSKAQELGLPILARWVGAKCVGVPPRIMGIGPAVAIPEVLKEHRLRIEDVDIYEINEAFASQALYTVKVLGIPTERVNPKGGAIALGHPLGMTGARQIATLLPELKRQDKKLGIVSMCMGAGMGLAALIVSEQ